MDDTERLVEKFLRSLGYSGIVYEPDGNAPPDFLLDGCIAVEARRLNQHFEKSSGRLVGLEDEAYRLHHRFQNLLRSFGESNRDESWSVSYDFSRPVNWTRLQPLIRQVLKEFRRCDNRSRRIVKVEQGFTLEFLPSSKAFDQFYVPGGSSDDDSGGWVLGEIERNLKICIAEKSRKAEPHRERYEKWWLVLEDRIGYGLNDDEQRRIRSMKLSKGMWEKILLVNPIDLEHYFEL